MKRILFIVILAFASAIFTNCEKEIEVKLKDADPKLVVEGKVYHGDGPHIVKLSKTTSFFGDGTNEIVKNANVVITDSEGNSELLIYQEEEEAYLSSSLKGVSGRSYKLEIENEGESYFAEAFMPDSISIIMSFPYYVDEQSASAFLESGYYVMGNFIDSEKENFYRVHIYEGLNREYLGKGWGGQPIEDFQLGGKVGEKTEVWIDPFRSFDPEIGEDTITVVVTSIDEQSYDYYVALENAKNSGGGFGGVPQNPPSNVSNGALGLFDAVAQTEYSVILPY